MKILAIGRHKRLASADTARWGTASRVRAPLRDARDRVARRIDIALDNDYRSSIDTLRIHPHPHGYPHPENSGKRSHLLRRTVMAVEKTTYADGIYSHLRDDILTGRLRPGDRLAEVEVAHRMGTSQGPVREAFTRLREQGLLISFPHRGSYVSEISEEEARRAYAVRGVIEPLALQWALPQMADEHFN